jgi:hypothetical protein
LRDVHEKGEDPHWIVVPKMKEKKKKKREGEGNVGGGGEEEEKRRWRRRRRTENGEEEEEEKKKKKKTLMWSRSILNSAHRTILIKINRIRSEIKYTFGHTFAA